MARRGVWQLQRLVFNYCEHSGSSRGARCGPACCLGCLGCCLHAQSAVPCSAAALVARALPGACTSTCQPRLRPSAAPHRPPPRREFVEQVWPRFRADNPHLALEVQARPGGHPFLEARYREWQRRGAGSFAGRAGRAAGGGGRQLRSCWTTYSTCRLWAN